MNTGNEFPDGKFVEDDCDCKWLDSKEGCELCKHPKGKMFCDYTWNGDIAEIEECPLYEPIYESSKVEEEVRQYLEYTKESRIL